MYLSRKIDFKLMVACLPRVIAVPTGEECLQWHTLSNVDPFRASSALFSANFPMPTTTSTCSNCTILHSASSHNDSNSFLCPA